MNSELLNLKERIASFRKKQGGRMVNPSYSLKRDVLQAYSNRGRMCSEDFLALIDLSSGTINKWNRLLENDSSITGPQRPLRRNRKSVSVVVQESDSTNESGFIEAALFMGYLSEAEVLTLKTIVAGRR